MIDNIILYNSLGWATFPVNAKTKEPACKDWPDREPNILQATADEEKYLATGAFGVVLRPQDLIFDVDPRNFENNVNPWKKIRQDLKLGKLSAPAVKTGGGGVHVYFLKRKDDILVSGLKCYPGLDIKTGGKGAYVIGAGSLHPNGKKYEFIPSVPLGEVKKAPEKLIMAFVRCEPQFTEGTGFTGGEQEQNRYISWLKKAPVAVEGENGDHQTYKSAVRGRDFGLSEEDTYSAMLEHYNPRCKPPWSEDELKRKVINAYSYATGAAGSEDPVTVFEKTEQTDWDTEDDAERKWDIDAHGNPKKTLRNAINYLYISPELKNTVRLNQFTADIEMTGRVPWWDKRTPGDMWTDTDVVLLKYHIAKTKKIEFSVSVLWEALHSAAIRFSYHPIREHIKDIEWDGEERLNNWLIKYCGAADTPYTCVVGRKLIIGMITRVFRPGVKFDYCLILEGKQGIGKSTVCNILGGKWYGDIILDPHARDTIDAMRGKWVIELSEMEVTRRAEAQALKAFISRTTDRARLAYARAALDFPRQCVFIGTINPDELGYLNDSTGNRRFWPVRCGEKIDLDGLIEVREQLLAEAYQAYKRKEPLYLDNDLTKMAEIEQKQRMSADPWSDVILAWLDTCEDIEEIDLPQIWTVALGGTPRSLRRSDQIRIGRVLKDLGFEKYRCRAGDMRRTVYRVPRIDVEQRIKELEQGL